MYLDGLQGLGEDPPTYAQLVALPWVDAYVPGVTKVYRGGGSGGHVLDPNMASTAAFVGPGDPILRANGYHGPILDTSANAGWQQISYGESSEYVRDFPVISRQLQDWLDANKITVKISYTQSGQRGVNYTSFWKDGKMVAINGVGWSNKPGFMKYLVIGFLAAVTGGAALTAAGVIGAGAGAASGAASAGGAAAAGGGVSATTVASGAATAAKALLPAASAAPAAVAAAAPVAATGATIASVASAAAPLVAKAVTVAAPIIKAQEDRKAKEVLVRAQMESQMPVAPPASMLTPPVTYPSGLGPQQQFQPLPSTTPSWLIPAAIGGVGLMVLMMMMATRPQGGPQRRA